MMAKEPGQHQRVDLAGTLQGSVHMKDDVQIINLSPTGGLIEHGARLSPGQTCVLFVQLRGVNVHLRAQMVWSRVLRTHGTPGARGGIRFRSGMRFAEPPGAEKAQLQAYPATRRPPRSTLAPGPGRSEPGAFSKLTRE